MWFHMVLSSGFNDEERFPFACLEQHVGVDEWKKRKWAFDRQEAEEFAAQKIPQLENYDKERDKVVKDEARVGCGEMTREEFIAIYRHALVDSTTSAIQARFIKLLTARDW
ncbi:hypothetical protein BKA56DRAFT_622096 [Ilyonectria sp. MPI-CAGE-AT-0026]|nr:hypothetical protein BKA56DRAFT_626420 [Ilyonectria sp. MPI-CAGE-AT-0026]KAH6970389.1 hypothetical protein BKA56DRAFT_622096 [Ilyonectria sp. MPI-CAGE-AT-0026]